jgi:hypothetical protein
MKNYARPASLVRRKEELLVCCAAILNLSPIREIEKRSATVGLFSNGNMHSNHWTRMLRTPLMHLLHRLIHTLRTIITKYYL